MQFRFGSLLNIFLFLVVVAKAQVDPRRVTIARDSFGVPHIFAATDPEVAYGLAWANAEDDFTSMQQLLLPARGSMGKVLGKEGAAGDYAFALFRCYSVTEERWHMLAPDYVRVVEAYVQGVNDYARLHPEQCLLPRLFPITPKEYIAASVLALVVFNGADNALRRIYSNRVWTVPGFSSNKGSNAAAVHASISATGESFLLINAHQPNTGPQAFYEAHVCSEEGWNAMGGLLAGATSILHGVNEHLGWAHTVNFCDRTDIFQLQMHPTKRGFYRFDDQWLQLEQNSVRLRIKGIPFAIKRNVYWSIYGATMKNKQGYFSIRMGANMRIGALQQWYHMNKAKNFSEFYAALQQQELSMFNIMYADRYDTIFYINNALMPIRDTSSTFNWRRTLPGNTSQTLWKQFRSLRELPQYMNPASGYLFNTNHSSFSATGIGDNLKPEKFSRTDGWEQYQNNRSVRYHSLISNKNPLDYEAFKKIKFDKQYPPQFQFLYALDTLYWLQSADYPAIAGVIRSFQEWDRQGTAGSNGAAIFLLLYERLSQVLDGQDARPVTKAEAVAAFTYVQQYLQQHFDRIDVTLGDVQKLVRGNAEFPLWGLPDLLSPQWTTPLRNGTRKAVGGDGYIMFVRFRTGSLPEIETINMYGASARENSPHFNDQIPLYLQQKTKRMTLDKAVILQTAVRTYHPGQ